MKLHRQFHQTIGVGIAGANDAVDVNHAVAGGIEQHDPVFRHLHTAKQISALQGVVFEPAVATRFDIVPSARAVGEVDRVADLRR